MAHAPVLFHEINMEAYLNSPHWARILIIEASPSTLGHRTLGRTPLDKWSARRRDLWLSTTLTRDIHAPGGIRTHNPNKRPASDHPIDQAVHIFLHVSIRRLLVWFLDVYIFLRYICKMQLCWQPVAAVRYAVTHRQYTERDNIMRFFGNTPTEDIWFKR